MTDTKTILVTALSVASAITFLWTVFRYQRMFWALIDSFPPQFRDELGSRFAFGYIVIAPSTPLKLQRDFLKVIVTFCFCLLSTSLAFFFLGEIIACLVFLAACLLVAVQVCIVWRTYRDNCVRHEKKGDRETS